MPVRLPGHQLPLRETDETWRNRAVGLAFEKHLDKQCKLVNVTEIDGRKYAVFNTLSATSPNEYYSQIRADDQAAGCNCEAGTRGNPCSHVGASYLVLYGITTERKDVPPLAL